MSKSSRCGKRKLRDQNPKRHPKLGYYFILTDTEETEKNYLYRLRDTLPERVRENLVIRVVQAKTVKLVDTAIEQASRHPQYSEVWIVFDRDRVANFDQIIQDAETQQIHVGWSNPCIKIWFYAYFGSMPTYMDSVLCCKKFGQLYEMKTGQKYRKADEGIYKKLCEYGNEETAIQLAKQKQKEHIRNGKNQPSEMVSGTTLYQLVQEIKVKAEEL